MRKEKAAYASSQAAKGPWTGAAMPSPEANLALETKVVNKAIEKLPKDGKDTSSTNSVHSGWSGKTLFGNGKGAQR